MKFPSIITERKKEAREAASQLEVRSIRRDASTVEHSQWPDTEVNCCPALVKKIFGRIRLLVVQSVVELDYLMRSTDLAW